MGKKESQGSGGWGSDVSLSGESRGRTGNSKGKDGLSTGKRDEPEKVGGRTGNDRDSGRSPAGMTERKARAKVRCPTPIVWGWLQRSGEIGVD
jgi:hypothetical protein